MYKCQECEKVTLKILGIDEEYGDCIVVGCTNKECFAEYKVEPDGLGQGGMEFVKAQIISAGFS